MFSVYRLEWFRYTAQLDSMGELNRSSDFISKKQDR